MDYVKEYNNKLVSANEAVEKVQSGDVVDYGDFCAKPVLCDQALAKRYEELNDVQIYGVLTMPPFPEVIKYPNSFIYHDWHFSKVTRFLQKQFGTLYYSPIMYHMAPLYYRETIQRRRDFFILRVAPMDNYGFFNLGPQNSKIQANIEKAKTVIIEVNKNIPICYGGEGESLHISQVDYIVEAPEHHRLFDVPQVKSTKTDQQIAAHILNHLYDGCCIQLGIGGISSVMGSMIADSDLKNLGGHTEMFCEAFIDMIESGKMNGIQKSFDRGKVAYTFAVGTRKMFDYMDRNPNLASYPVDYVNDPCRIAQLDNMVSINNAIQVDLFSQVNAESLPNIQISGNGGMLDFVMGSQWSKNGKSFICLSSTYKDDKGEVKSRIIPKIEKGSIVTIPRQMVDYMVTEYGCVQLKTKPVWERAELLINIAHPDFRDELVVEAENNGIWRKSNKIG